MKSNTNELWRCWNLAWYHRFIHIACAKKLWRLRQKLDALHVQTRLSLTKYEGFGRKLIGYKGISFFETYFNSKLFVHWICSIKSNFLKFRPFVNYFLFFMHLMIYFALNDPEIEKQYQWTLKWLKLGMVLSFHPHSMCYRVERVRQKLDALRVQTGPSPSKYESFGQKLICYKGISISPT